MIMSDRTMIQRFVLRGRPLTERAQRAASLIKRW
jgi:hypothetical protein